MGAVPVEVERVVAQEVALGEELEPEVAAEKVVDGHTPLNDEPVHAERGRPRGTHQAVPEPDGGAEVDPERALLLLKKKELHRVPGNRPDHEPGPASSGFENVPTRRGEVDAEGGMAQDVV